MSRSTRVQRFCRRGGVTLASAALGFLVIQALLAAAIEFSPALRDPEFGQKLSRLQEQLAEHPGRPLLLIVGSSRSSCGLQPSAISCPSLGDGSQPLIFNMALTGYGPVQQLELLARLHRIGIRPRWILAEILPVLLHQQPGQLNQEWIPPERLDWQDLTVVRPYLSSNGDWLWRWATLRTLPAWWFRLQIMNYLAPGWLDTHHRHDGAWRDLDDEGWLPLSSLDEGEPAEERRRRAHDHYAPAFSNYHITATADAALRQFTELAQRDGATVGLYLMPEGDAFRSWYPVGAHEGVVAYLGQLAQEADVTVFDASTWCAESDFADSHHLLSIAARNFSQRFGEEVVARYLNRQLPESSLTATASERSHRAPR